MASTDHYPHAVHVHTIHERLDHPDNYHPHQQGLSITKVLAVVALLPVGLTLLGLAGITLAGTLIGLALATPVFVIFSPILVPAVLTIGLAMAGFLTSGTFGLTGLSSLSFLVNCLRQLTGSVQDLVEYTGQKTKDVGQSIQDKAHEIGHDDHQVYGGGPVATNRIELGLI